MNKINTDKIEEKTVESNDCDINNTVNIKTKLYKNIIDELKLVELKINNLYHDMTSQSARRYSRNIIDNQVAILLNDDFSTVDYIPGLKTTLYRHQKTAVKAMLDLEKTRKFSIKNDAYGVIRHIVYNAAVLSEPVGSGKTIDILSIILLNKIPVAIPDIMSFSDESNSDSMGFIRRRFKKFIKPTIIFVGISVMKQWQTAIKTFTDLKVYSINSIKELRLMMQLVVNGTINNYDIVLVKNGKISVPITLPEGYVLEDKNKTSNAYIYNVIANLRHCCWARVIIDDFDTIRLPNNAGIVNGLFTWYISSTRKKMEYRIGGKQLYNSTSELLKNHDYGCSNIIYNHFMFCYLNVRNDSQFLKETIYIPNPKYHIAIFKNPNNLYMSLLHGMENEQIDRITEMLNADAIGDAAEAAGIKTNSVANIFESIIGSKFKQYRYSGDLLAFIEHLREEESKRLAMSENPNKNDRYGKKDLLDFREVEYKYPGVNSIINATEEEYTEIKHDTGKSIQRVKDNIRHGICPICRDELSETKDTAIAKCCGTVFCGNCGIEGQNINDKYSKLSGRCSNCRTPISIKDLIFMENFDLSKIENEDFEDEDTADNSKYINTTNNKLRTKYTAIIDIIMNRLVPESKRVDMYIPNMMKGSIFLREPIVRKVLIFANYDSTLKKVINELEEEKIHYWRLMGSATDIDTISKAFTLCKTTCAMVINSTKHCSGLNLQTATDLVFSHNIINPDIESQVAGRGHRLGRTSPLNIWFMQYDNEYESLISTHGVRIIRDDELLEEKKFDSSKQPRLINNKVDAADIKQHRNERNNPSINKNTRDITQDSDSDSDY